MAKLKRLVQEGGYSIGEHVLVGATQESGIIKFIGTTQFSGGEWVGVELEQPQGKNDGIVKDIKYFDCKPKHGIFVRKTALLRPKQAEEVIKGTKEKDTKAAKSKGAKALAAGIQTGKVGKIVDKIEKQGQPESPTTSKEDNKSNATSKATKTEVASRSASKSSAKAPDELDEGAISALCDLRQAAEDHNPDEIRKALIVAERNGVPEEELCSAHRILAFVSHRDLCKEIDKVQNLVAGLAEVARQTQVKANSMTQIAESNVGHWVTTLVKRIEGCVWEGLEKKIEERIESIVRAVASEMLTTVSKSSSRGMVRKGQFGEEARSTAATKIQMAWRRRIARLTIDADNRGLDTIVSVARKRNQAWALIFEEKCAKRKSDLDSMEPAVDALDCLLFHEAITEVHPRLAQGQTNVLFKGYTDGTDRCDIDLVGFLGICEAVAVGDQAAAEFADMNVATFQNLANPGATEAALKIQCAQRQRAARVEASSRKQAKQEKPGGTLSLQDFWGRMMRNQHQNRDFVTLFAEGSSADIRIVLQNVSAENRARLDYHLGLALGTGCAEF